MHRTTIRLDENLLVEAKEYASRHRRTLTSVIEDALRALMAHSRRAPVGSVPTGRLRLPVSKQKGGLMPGVNLDSNSELLDLMERGLPLDKRR